MKFLSLICCFYCSFSFAEKPIVIGVPLFDPPYVVATATVTEGFDIDLMNAICSRLGWACEYLPLRIPGVLEAVQQNKVDFAIGSIVITADRRQQFAFSIPYLVCDGGFTTLADSGLHNLSDLQGKRVGALRLKEYYEYLTENFTDQFTIVPFDTYQDIILALKNRKIDAVFGNYYSALYLDHQYPHELTIFKEHYSVGEGLGIIASPNNRDKIHLINKTLLQFQADGTFIGLYNYHFEFFTKQPAMPLN